MTFPETRVDLNRLIEKVKPELRSESFQNCKNTFLKNTCKPTYFDYLCGADVAHGSIKSIKIIPIGNQEPEL